MEIKIDTSKDSHEHIRKVIELLKHVVGEQSASSSASATFDVPAANPFAGMFGDPAAPAEAPAAPVVPETPPAAPSQPQAVDIWGNPKKPDPDIGIEVY